MCIFNIHHIIISICNYCIIFFYFLETIYLSFFHFNYIFFIHSNHGIAIFICIQIFNNSRIFSHKLIPRSNIYCCFWITH